MCPLFDFPLGSECLLVVGLARRAALRSPKGGAFRAKRRAKSTTGGRRRFSSGFPLCPTACRFAPRVIGRRHPSPSGQCDWHARALTGRRSEHVRLSRRGNLPPVQRAAPVHGDSAVRVGSSDFHSAPPSRRRARSPNGKSDPTPSPAVHGGDSLLASPPLAQTAGCVLANTRSADRHSRARDW